MIIPLRTNVPLRRRPLMNYGLIAFNTAVLVFFRYFAQEDLITFRENVLTLDAGWPQWWQFLTYQFLHAPGAGGWEHLIGNMLFLWVFGNAVNSKLGHVPYLLFYLAGGAFAGWGFALGNDNSLVGASGSVAAVTIAYMVLFPRSRILFLFLFILITVFELPALWIILLKVVVWDNMVSPMFSTDAVAYSAHLFGYLFGFIATMGMLLLRAISRDQFDLPSVMKRWYQRRSAAAAAGPVAHRQQQQYATVARPIRVDPRRQREREQKMDRVASLRGKIREALMNMEDPAAAVDFYEELMTVDPQQCLSRQQQLEMARLLYARQRHPQAASAFEKYLKYYPRAEDVQQVHLLLGIIYARDLDQPEAAEPHLKLALEQLTDPKRREQCEWWLGEIASHRSESNTPASDQPSE